MAAEVGTSAPDFELRDQHNQPVRLSDYREKRLVSLVFYPFAFSTLCEAELCELRDDLAAYQDDDAVIIGISCDAPATHRRQAEEQGYAFSLLSDFWPHGEAARRYGVFDEGFGAAQRATFLVDREGIVRYRLVQGIGEPRDPAGLRDAVAALRAQQEPAAH